MSREDTQFKPGQSGNPKGRPPSGESWQDILEEAFGEEVELNGDKKTFKRLVAEVLRKHALKGDVRHIQIAMERMEGKPKETVEQNTGLTVNWADPGEKDI